MLMLSYIIVCTFIDMAHIGDISDLFHIVIRSIRSHIASRADVRTICWELHFGNLLACHYVVVHSRLLMYHHLLGHRKMSISCV